jgi:hypothetical protein
MRALVGVFVALIFMPCFAQDWHQDFDRHSVHYNVFNSTMVPADVAAAYGIKRSAYESLLNVSIAPKGEYGAYPALVSGYAQDLMGKRYPLKFIEISEQTATYYIAPIRVSGEELLHFKLEVKPEGEDQTLEVNFTKKIYSDP